MLVVGGVVDRAVRRLQPAHGGGGGDSSYVVGRDRRRSPGRGQRGRRGHDHHDHDGAGRALAAERAVRRVRDPQPVRARGRGDPDTATRATRRRPRYADGHHDPRTGRRPRHDPGEPEPVGRDHGRGDRRVRPGRRTTAAACRSGRPQYTVAAGQVFATNYKVVSLSGTCGQFLFGDSPFSLCKGEQVIK